MTVERVSYFQAFVKENGNKPLDLETIQSRITESVTLPYTVQIKRPANIKI